MMYTFFAAFRYDIDKLDQAQHHQFTEDQIYIF